MYLVRLFAPVASTFNFRANNGVFKCTLKEDEIIKYVSSSHFTSQEISALHLHYELVSSTKREDGLIDQTEFQLALGFALGESLYVDRIFQLIDSNGDGYISFDEFITSASILSSKGTIAQKVDFSFNVLDFNQDELIDKDELRKMMMANVNENVNITLGMEALEEMIAQTMKEVDLDQDGFINKEEYT